ncbi:cobalamin biosynthesis protein [Paraburkholderia sp. J12]|uniref:cobalamin biosynthesis protein n=1 Tax=Paraburkholderia sp. J12 TaxID=2805432 RepID=UPI002ABD72E5|nr:cobalamin biosynthesis protein [Paraburkholderia sp. J12]
MLSYARIRRALRLEPAPPRPLLLSDALTVNSAPSASQSHAPSSASGSSGATEDEPLVLGIGCRRGVTLAQIERAVQAALDGTPLARVTAVGTLDAKANEPALRQFCDAHGLPLHAYARDALAAVPTQTAPSAAALAHFGVEGVCEPCARLASGGGPLLRGKLALDGVTVAIALGRPNDNAAIYAAR